MSEILIATFNRHKAREIAGILGNGKLNFRFAWEFEKLSPPDETGTTIRENALIKARSAFKATGIPSLADDTGLETDCLDGAPGVYSARFAGDGATYAQNNAKLLRLLEGVEMERRGAVFKCCMALVLPNGNELVAEGTVRGKILESPRGEGGFGYDPLFMPDGSDMTYAQMSDAEKNALSHRYRALEKMRKILAGGALML